MRTVNYIKLDVSEAVARITLAKPGRRNAIDIEMAREFAEAVEFAQREGAAVVILRAEGSVFSSGIDLKCAEGGRAFDIVRDTLDHAQLLWIAQIEGPFIGGAVAYVAQCHLAIASEESWFSLPEVRHDVYPHGVVEILKRSIAPSAILPITLSGDQYSAAHAHAIGLVTKVVQADRVAGEAEEWAARVAKLSANFRNRTLLEWSSAHAICNHSAASR